MTIKPGFGFEQLHLRESADELTQRFGDPRERRGDAGFREYWLYPSEYFDCIVSKKSHLVLSLFLHIGNSLITDLEGSTETRIREMFPSPTKEGGGQTLMTGKRVGRWLTYNEGIGFDFDEEGKLRTVSIFAAKQCVRSKSKPAGATHQRQSQLIAAMRLS